MKKTFMKLLPIVAAILFAISCGKDDDNNGVAVDEVVTPEPAQEVVENNIKTITISGKVSPTNLSKVTVEGGSLKLQKGDEFKFGTENSVFGAWGSIVITNPDDGSYEATLYYPEGREDALLAAQFSFTAEHGTQPTTISSAYNSLEAAVHAAYYVINFYVKKNGDTYTLVAPWGYGDIQISIKSAFIRANYTRSIIFDGKDVNVQAGKYYIVPLGKRMGSGTSTTQEGKVYNVNQKKGTLSYGWGNTSVLRDVSVASQSFTQPLTHVGGGTVTYSIVNHSTLGTASINSSTGAVTCSGYCNATITATVTGDDEYAYSSTTASYELTVVPDEFVDLGIIGDDGNSILWAVENVNGNSIHIKNYFPFGSVKGVDQLTTPKDYSYGFGTYVIDPNILVENYYTHNNTRLPKDNKYDAAFKDYSYSRIPIVEEWEALMNGAYWVWDDTQNGYMVYKVRSNDHKGKVKTKTGGDDYTEYYSSSDPHIFLPALGRYTVAYTSATDDPDPNNLIFWWDRDNIQCGFYWSGDFDGTNGAYILKFDGNGVEKANCYVVDAIPIRAIRYLKY
ncbi:MAG: hypothetical protein J6X05_00195 [Bacteroidales bacterium]|nr:hypothetical protein [Bacteroidales bacterium]